MVEVVLATPASAAFRDPSKLSVTSSSRAPAIGTVVSPAVGRTSQNNGAAASALKRTSENASVRSGGTGGVEDAEETAYEATTLFISQQFESCKETLQRLHGSGCRVLQVEHAERLLKFLDRRSTDVQLVDDLTALLEGGNQGGANPFEVYKRGQEGVDSAIPALNKAILLFHQHKYLSSVALLEPLYSHIDSLDSGAAIRVCFLLLDIYLRFRQISQATAILNYLHQALPGILDTLCLSPTTTPTTRLPHNPSSHPLRSTSTSPETTDLPQANTLQTNPSQANGPHPPYQNTASNTPPQPVSVSPVGLQAGGGLPSNWDDDANQAAMPRVDSHPVSVSQGPSPNAPGTSQGQQLSRDSPQLDSSIAVNKIGSVAAYTGYVAALGAELPEAGAAGVGVGVGVGVGTSSQRGDVHEANGGESKSESGVHRNGYGDEEGARGPACTAGAAVLFLPHLSKLTSRIVRKAEQLQPGVTAELGRWESDVRLAFRAYKAQLHLLTSNTKAAKRELKAAVNAGASKQLVAMMKAQLEMCRGNFTKASRLLVALVQDRSVFTSCPMQLLNNLGVLHHLMGQQQTAALYFSKALKTNSRHRKAAAEKSSAPQQPHMDQSACLLYNAGLEQLVLKNFMLALRCFRRASCSFYHQPLLWLRLAESAVGVAGDMKQEHQQWADNKTEQPSDDITAPSGAELNGKDMVSQALVASGVGSMSDPSSPGALGGVVDAVEPSQPAWLQLHNTHAGGYLDYAQHCLDTALALLDTSQHDSLAAEAQSPHMSAGRSVGSLDVALDSPRDASIGLGSPHPLSKQGDSGDEVYTVRAAVLALSAYVHLQQDHLHAALAAARTLLALPSCPASCHFLATCYAAEALVHLGMASEAMDLLSDQMVVLREAEQGARPDSAAMAGDEARVTLYCNMAAVYISQGDFTTAVQCAQQALQVCPNHRARLLVVYSELARGNAAGAMDILRSHAQQH